MQYEKAASMLRKRDPPVVPGKVDAYDESNKEHKDKYKVHGYPAIKINRKGGSDVSAYGGPRDVEGIVEYLTRQVGPASLEIRSAVDASRSIGDKGGVVLVSSYILPHLCS